MMNKLVVQALLLLGIGHEAAAQAQNVPVLNNLSSPYTLTAYAPCSRIHNGLKVNNWNIFQSMVSQYCPSDIVSPCPNGTDMVLAGSLYPVSEVPGGQDTYVAQDGAMAITVQHSHSFPPGSFPEYEGWTWNALPVQQLPLEDCPIFSDLYNCNPPTGYWTFQVPNATVGGVKACESNGLVHIYAVTPNFNQTGCVTLKGLGTHPYSGPNPPVWAYD